MATIIERDTRSSAAEGMSFASIILAVLAVAIVGALALYAFQNGAVTPSATNPDTNPGGTIEVDVNGGGTPQNTNPY